MKPLSQNATQVLCQSNFGFTSMIHEISNFYAFIFGFSKPYLVHREFVFAHRNIERLCMIFSLIFVDLRQKFVYLHNNY